VDNEVTVARIYLREADHGKRRTLMQEVLNILHDQQRVQSLVVFRGIAGFDDSGEIRASDVLRLNVDLPLVIEFFDTPKVVDAALALLDDLVPAEQILTWRAERRERPASGPRQG
jgi:PII-like signaling protein